MSLFVLVLTSSLFLAVSFLSATASAVQNGLAPGDRVPVLYEAYYPETQKRMDPTDQLERLRELTRELLQQEELLQALSSQSKQSNSRMDSFMHQPLEYIFPAAPTPATTTSTTTTTTQREPEQLLESLTLSESRSPADVVPGGPPRSRKTRHHHGRADWFIKRLAAAINRAD